MLLYTCIHGQIISELGSFEMSRPGFTELYEHDNPADLTDVLRLPPNLPMNDAHWRDQVLPGFEVKIHSYKDVLNFIAMHRTTIGMNYDPMNPPKPVG